MRRGMLTALYGLGGLVAAATLAWAAFTVAGQPLSTPAEPIQPVSVAAATPSVSPTVARESSASPATHRHHHATPASSPRPATAPVGVPTAARTIPPVTHSSPPHPSDDSSPDGGSGHGDD